MMAPVGSACQNAENAPFYKRAILVKFWVKSEREFTFLSGDEIFLFLSSLSARHSAPIFFSLFSVFFRSLFISKIRASINTPKNDVGRLSEF